MLILACIIASKILFDFRHMLLIGFFAVLQVYSIVLLVKRPYVRALDNILFSFLCVCYLLFSFTLILHLLDVVSQFTLLATLFCGLFIGFSMETEQKEQISYLAFAMNAGFLLIGVACVIYHQGKAIYRKIEKKRRKKQLLVNPTEETKPLLEYMEPPRELQNTA